MTTTCHSPSYNRCRLAKAFLILALFISLLFVTQAQPVVLPVEMKQGGGCAGMQCVSGCCANLACCKVMEQQKTPQPPAATPQSNPVQLATIGLRVSSFLFRPPVRRHSLIVRDEAGAAHTLPPLAVTCIWLT